MTGRFVALEVARDTGEWRVRVIPHRRSEVDTDAPRRFVGATAMNTG